MTYRELYESAINKLEKNEITLGEFEKMTEPLNAKVGGDSDTISRAKAIEALKNDMASLDHIIKGMSANDVRLDAYVSQRNQVNYDIYTINNLPPAPGTDLAEVGTDAISRQQAIRWVKTECNPYGKPTLDFESGKKVIEHLEQMPPIHPEPHWIPVTENTLPDENRVVVVCGEKGTWDYGTYRGHGDNIHFWHWKKNTYKRVYWWMYKEDALPEPYKEVTT